jgi:hypothetical protein
LTLDELAEQTEERKSQLATPVN